MTINSYILLLKRNIYELIENSNFNYEKFKL